MTFISFAQYHQFDQARLKSAHLIAGDKIAPIQDISDLSGQG